MNQKERNYRAGAVKRLLKIKPGEKVETGGFMKKANTLKAMNPKERTAVLGMI